MRTTTLTLALLAPLGPATLWAALLWLAPPPAHAQWTNDPYNGMVSVCTAPGNQEGARICALSNGNTLTAWYDERTGVTQTFYQVLNSLGVPLLEINGRPIFEGGWSYGWGGPDLDGLVADGQGGCIAIVIDNRSPYWDIYGQRFDSLGNRLWGATGLPLVEWPEGNTILKDVVTDGLGNGFIAWCKNYQFYLQKFDLDTGERLWGDMGVMDRDEIAWGDYQQIVADGQGGAMDVWADNRSGGSYYKLYVQHLDANGNPLLAVNGIPVLDLYGQQIEMGILEEGVPDGRGGGLWAWVTSGSANYQKVIRLNGQGQTLWIWTSSYYGSHAFYDMKRHSVYNTVWISVWEGRPGAPGTYLYQLDIQGHALFGSGGLPYGGIMSETSDGMMTFDGSFVAQHTRLFARRVNFRGRLVWASNAALGGTGPGGGPVFVSPVGASDGADGAVMAFVDDRNAATEPDISAQRVQRNGRLGNPTFPQSVAAVEPQSLQMLPDGQVQFLLPQAGQIKLELFDLLGRRVATLREGFEPAGMQTIPLDNSNLPSGIYLMRLSTSAGAHVIKVLITH